MKMIKTDTNLKISCDACAKIIPLSDCGTIKLSCYDPVKKYKSGRKFISNFRWRMCAKCHNKMRKMIGEVVDKM